jgi:hypothetical protein
METFNSKDFVSMFNEVKTQEKGRKGIARGLSDKDERNFKKLVKRGFTLEEMRAAAVQMFRDPEQWAVNSGNDIPTHFLISGNFERYFNAAVNVEEKKAEDTKGEEVSAAALDSMQERKRREEEAEKVFLEQSRQLYTESLLKGIWIGTEYNAGVIGLEFKNSFTQEEKNKIWNEIQAENEKSERLKRSLLIGKIIESKIINPRREFAQRIVKEAVKRKISEPWK